jgi:uncharacterized lipoprotein YehR (DUF1307 family)
VENNIHYETLKIQQDGDEQIMKQRQEIYDMFKGVGHSQTNPTRVS